MAYRAQLRSEGTNNSMKCSKAVTREWKELKTIYERRNWKQFTNAVERKQFTNAVTKNSIRMTREWQELKTVYERRNWKQFTNPAGAV